jgi:leader peptidase (prepilin peptidase)/N-methyltransferase
MAELTLLPSWLLATLAGVLGLNLGSFLNVCTLRWPVDESVVSPPSRCPGCEEPIRWYDNIPVLSWLLLRGRCRNCRLPISIQYPIVELATGLIWAGVVYRYGLDYEALRGALFLTILFGIALSDARFYIIPDQFSLGGMVLGFGLAFLPGGLDWKFSLYGAALGYGGFWLLGWSMTWFMRRFTPERLEAAGVDQALGGGDVKMMGMVGAFLGPVGVGLTVFLGTLMGLVIFVPISMRTGKLIPFGIFLAAGAAVTWGWGNEILEWYLVTVVGIPVG